MRPFDDRAHTHAHTHAGSQKSTKGRPSAPGGPPSLDEALCKPLRHRQPMAAVRGPPDLVPHGWTAKRLGVTERPRRPSAALPRSAKTHSEVSLLADEFFFFFPLHAAKGFAASPCKCIVCLSSVLAQTKAC